MHLQNNSTKSLDPLELAIRLILSHALQLRTSFPKILQVDVYNFRLLAIMHMGVTSHINVSTDLVQQYHQTLKWS